MDEEEIIRIILGEATYIHKDVGAGLLEAVYKNCLAYRLKKRGLLVEVEVPIPVEFEEVRMNCGYRADIIVEKKIIIEVKSIAAIADIEVAQTLTYLRFAKLRYGLILNFNTVLMKHGIKRVLRGY
jgi:GxxExxY protein